MRRSIVERIAYYGGHRHGGQQQHPGLCSRWPTRRKPGLPHPRGPQLRRDRRLPRPSHFPREPAVPPSTAGSRLGHRTAGDTSTPSPPSPSASRPARSAPSTPPSPCTALHRCRGRYWSRRYHRRPPSAWTDPPTSTWPARWPRPGRPSARRADPPLPSRTQPGRGERPGRASGQLAVPEALGGSNDPGYARTYDTAVDPHDADPSTPPTHPSSSIPDPTG